MAIKEKLDLLMLGNEERIKAQEKFLAPIALTNEEELKDIINFLSSQGVYITKAREIKVIGNSKDEIAKKFSILSEIHETDIYKQDPTMINRNVIDVYKKLQYCKQNNIPYKKEDGTYEPFLFSELLWGQKTNINREEKIAPVVTPVEEELVTLEPEITAPIEEIVNEPVMEEKLDTSKFMDIKDYMEASNDLDNLQAETTSFQTIKEELEGQLAELDALKSELSFDEISFNDLEPESYGMGR